ncbi:DUF6042 family protein [Streptomyces sp. NPDC046203]|uniref:DUF6042 family protein n=1 Tax=Streptomyces sp. NPDC046203 TaxID=3154602 RepID=UPI0033C31705
MSVEQDVQQQLKPGDLALHNDWYASGWPVYLPRDQAMVLCMLFGTVTVRELRGSIDEVLDRLLEYGPVIFLGRDGGSLDDPVIWTHQDDLDCLKTEEDKARFRVESEAHRERCEHLLRTAGLAVPATVRDVADLMIAVGIADCRDGVWSMPERLPGPETVLALSDEERDDVLKRRRRWEGGAAVRAVNGHLEEGLNRPEEIFTSLGRLAGATELDEDDVRYALEQLIEADEARIERGDPRERAALDGLKSHERFHLVLDWRLFDENRPFVVTRPDRRPVGGRRSRPPVRRPHRE